ncbi:MAG TPA: calcium-binding protein [Micromonospora sp.]|nr:calcium-binding protein [Micromonospora sp.]
MAAPLALGTAVPAQAEPAWETALKGLVVRTANWTQGLGQVGQLAKPLPLLGVSPGDLVDVDGLVKRASDALVNGLNQDVDLGDGARLTSSVVEVDGDHLLDVVLTVKRTVTGKRFSAGDITIDNAVSVTGWATLRLKVRHTAAGEAYLVRDGQAPRIDIDAAAHLGSLADAKASVGVLGVAVTSTAEAESSLDATAHLKVTVNDPNNDGKLSFDTPAGTGTGELAAAGSLAGLVQVGFDASAGGKISDTEMEAGPGRVHGQIHLGAAASGGPLVFNKSIKASVTLDWPNITVGTPTITTSGFDETLAKFRNMSPVDLAAGLAQLATLIAGVQASGPAGNKNLPFLRGTFADAVKVNEKLVAFLHKAVHPNPEDPEFQPGDDPAEAGQPKFTSLQELFTLLAAEGLLDTAALPAGGISLVEDKLAFPLKFEVAKDSASWTALDPGAASVSGKGAMFSSNGFTLPTDRFQPGALAGQRVVAGTSAGTIETNDERSITLASGWIGGQPAADSTWVISSSDPQTGAVELGGALSKTANGGKQIGLRSANAQASFAEVKASYTARVTVVLDLRDITDPDANADRLMLRTDPAVPLFTASFPIRTGIDFYATAGFLKVKLGGSLEVNPVAPATDMLTVAFRQARDVSLGDLFQELKADPAALFAVTTSVRADGEVKVSVPGASGVLGSGVGADVSWDVADPAPTVDTSSLSDLFALDFNPDDPQALFALVIAALQQVSVALAEPGTGTGLLDEKLPLIGRSARQLLGTDHSGVGAHVSYADDGDNFILVDAGRTGESTFTNRLAGRTVVIGSRAHRVLSVVDGQTLQIGGDGTGKPADGTAYALRPEIADAIDALLAKPPQNLQDAIALLNERLGAGSGVTFALDERAGEPYLRLGLDWQRTFRTGVPLDLNWDGARSLISLDSSGTFAVDVSGRAQLGLLLPLQPGGALLLDKASSASVTVNAAASGVALAARVGPLALEVGRTDDPGAVKANLSFNLGGLSADGPVTDLFGLAPSVTTAGVDCGDGGTEVALCASAPVFVTGCALDGGNILAVTVDTALVTGGSLPDLSECFNNLSLNLTDFDHGIDGYLSKLEVALRLASFDGKLPLVGDDLQQGERFIAQLRQDIKDAIGEALATAPPDNHGLAAALDAALAPLGDGVHIDVNCADGVETCPLEELQSVRIRLEAGKGEPSAAAGCQNDCEQLDVPLDLGIPGLSLKAEQGATDGVQVKLGWKLHLDLVLDRDIGFYVATHGVNDGDDTSPELQIGASFDVPADLDAQLAFIQVNAHKQGSGPLAVAYFAIDLKASPGEASCFEPPTGCEVNSEARLTLDRFGDLGSLLATNLTANINIDWQLTAKVDAGGNEVLSALPGISAVFQLKWGLANHRSALAVDGATVTTPLEIKFSDIALDAGQFFSQILKPVLDKIKAVTGPLQPIIDTLYAPIPVLSDLSRAIGGGDITLIYLARTFSTLNGGPNLDFVDTIRSLVSFVNRIPSCTASCKIPLGQFQVHGANALTTPVSPASAESLIDRSASFTQAKTAEQVKDAVDDAANGEKLFESGDDGKNNADKIGFKFPIFDNPGSLFGLLLGQDVELISFDSGPLTLGFSWRQSFGPVYAPPPVMLTLSGSASVSARIMAGLDTAGIRHAIEAATGDSDLNAVKLLDGLYFKTADERGNAVPVVTMRGEIAAGAQVSVLILSAGVEGGVRLTVGFSWNDPNNDGKFRTSEFLQRLLVNPVCLFTATGQLSIFLKVYIKISLVFYTKKFSFTLVNAVLLDFRAQPDCSPPPPELGGTVGDTLVVFAGRFGTAAQRGDAAWDNTKATYAGDVIKIYALHFADADEPDASPDFDGFAVEALGRRQEFLDPSLTRVVVDGRGYQLPDGSGTAMSVIFLGDGDTSKTQDDEAGTVTSTFDKTAVVIGSDGDDHIKTGSGPAYIDAGSGNDTIITGEGAGAVSWIAGGNGDDNITTGDGNNLVAGDGGLGVADQAGVVTVRTSTGTVPLTGLIDWNALNAPSSAPNLGSGADQITVGRGSNTVHGNGGDDMIGVRVGDRSNGKNTLVGGAGSDTISGGDGDDKIYTYDTYGNSEPPSPDDQGSGDAGLTNIADTGAGNDLVYGSRGTDMVSSRSANGQMARIYGFGGDDVLVGGYGEDEIFGGPGDDYVIAEPSTVLPADPPGDDGYGPRRLVTHEPLPAGTVAQAKLLVGGVGRDHVIGGDGGAVIYGDKYLPGEFCADNDTFTQVDPADQGDRDLILGGTGSDIVSAGGGDDRVDLGPGDDRACGQLGDDILHLGDGADKAWGGPGRDQLFGEAGEDLLFGNTGDDAIYGGAGADTIEGNDGADRAFGGPDDDTIYGGSRAAGARDLGIDHLYGDEGADRIVGDNGTPKVGDVGPYPLDLAGDMPEAGGRDIISGGDGDDIVYGGLGDDEIHGDAGDDHLEGNNGADVVYGDGGSDEIIGGSSQEASPGVGRPDTGDRLFGGDGADLIAGDNARFEPATDEATRVTQGRSIAPRKVTLLDLGFNLTAGTGGADLILGDDGDDVIFGQVGPDRIRAGDGDDYAEGGPGIDWIEGGRGQDDLVGGSSTPYDGSGADATGQPDGADVIFGGPDSDVILGDNGAVLRPLPSERPSAPTVRVGADGEPIAGRIVVLLDRHLGPGEDGWRGTPDPRRYGADRISGGDGVDLAWGQDGDDAISGGGDGDYLEGNGGADILRGDRPLHEAGHAAVTQISDPGWPGSPGSAEELNGPGAPDGQDDLIGGSASPGFRDTGDIIEGNGGADVILGDNGSLLRTIEPNGTERVYTQRYPAGAVPADATVSRTHDPALPGPSTRFCTTAQATCEPAGAFGDDKLYGDDGDDGIWGQDGDDTIHGGAGDDDLFGELGADVIFGGAGDDAILGDRGGVVNRYLNPQDAAALGFTVRLSGAPAEQYTGFRAGYYDRRVDLLHDTDGDTWIGGPTAQAMPHDGLTAGGDDRIRGGAGNDNIHAGYGDDLVNGDSGGDQIFGAGGADVLWGGKGCDPVLNADTPDCLTNGVFDPSARGDQDRFVDHIFGGAGATSGPAVAAVLGADLLDFKPRGSYPDNCAPGAWPLTTGRTTIDPCVWFEMTDMDNDATVGVGDNQHHQGTDWIYGGWDRDVLQADVAANGPNPGDRLFDWNGAYNLYTHCNAAYGGYNDIRQHSPAVHKFLTQLAWGSGAGRTAADVTTPGTSAYLELAYVYVADQKEHGVGKPYPGTPGHFDDPVSCTD